MRGSALGGGSPVVEEAEASRLGAALGGGGDRLGSCPPPLAGALEGASEH